MKNHHQKSTFPIDLLAKNLIYSTVLALSFFLVYAMFSAFSNTANGHFHFDIVNNTSYPDSSLYWTAVCQNRSGIYCHIMADGCLVPMDSLDNSQAVGTLLNCDSTNLFANYSFNYATNSSVTILDSALINSAILYISVGGFLPICVQSPSLGYAPPSFGNPNLQGYDMIIQAVEFAFNINGKETLNMNTTNVDEVGMAVKLVLSDSNGKDSVGFTTTRENLMDQFATCVDTNFQHLLITDSSDSDTIRILSPEHFSSSLNLNPTVTTYFQDFYNAYIDSCWNFYNGKSLDIIVNSDTFAGKLTNGLFTFTPTNPLDSTPAFSFTKPTSNEVMQANGQFIAGSVDQQNVGKFMAAAMYRTVFMEPSTNPSNSWCGASMRQKYFTNEPINYYAKILHANSIDGLCYAYGYSDVCSYSPSLSSTTTTSVKVVLTD